MKQRAGSDINHHFLIRLLKDPVRHCLSHTQAGDLPDLIAETRQVLHVHRSKNVHATVEQNLHVLPTPLPFRSGRVRMCQIVHDAYFWATLQDAGDIYLLDVTAAASHAEQWHRLKFLGSLDQVIAALRFEKREDDVRTARFELSRVLQHLVGLTYAGGVSQINLQLTSAFLVAHGAARYLVGKYPDINTSRRLDQTAHDASEDPRSQIFFCTMSDKNLSDAVGTRVSYDGPDRVFAFEHFHLCAGFPSLH